jgi:hypothetical protein
MAATAKWSARGLAVLAALLVLLLPSQPLSGVTAARLGSTTWPLRTPQQQHRLAARRAYTAAQRTHQPFARTAASADKPLNNRPIVGILTQVKQGAVHRMQVVAAGCRGAGRGRCRRPTLRCHQRTRAPPPPPPCHVCRHRLVCLRTSLCRRTGLTLPPRMSNGWRAEALAPCQSWQTRRLTWCVRSVVAAASASAVSCRQHAKAAGRNKTTQGRLTRTCPCSMRACSLRACCSG